jgi:hypothetical protein
MTHSSGFSAADANTALTKVGGEFIQRSDAEVDVDGRLRELWRDNVLRMGPQWAYHSNAFLKRQALSRLLYFDEIYRQILPVAGVICEFGVQYGAGMVTLTNLRGMYEPYNHSRHIFGFDTFEGFSAVEPQDGSLSQPGDYKVSQSYEDVLSELLSLHEQNAPLAHIRKWHLVKGDVSKTLPLWLDANPHAVVALAIFDMDLYRPTKDAISAIRPRLTRGSVLVFDELNCPHFPGETLALAETLGLNNLALRRHPHQPYCSFARFGD